MWRVTGAALPLLGGVAVLLLGGGLQGTLLGVRAGLELFPVQATGLIMSAYYAGYLAGFFVSPDMVHRVGHIRSFAVFASIASAVALLHALYVEPLAWGLLRFMSGMCFAGLFMVVESWLNATATNETRGAVLSVYMIVQLTALAGGQLLLNLSDPTGFPLFVITSVLMSLGLVPVALSSTTGPVLTAPTTLALAELYRISPLGVVGCFGSGLALGAFWGMGPLFAFSAGLSTSGVAWFMSLGILGGIVLLWPIGRLSDRHDRRLIITAVAFAIVATSLAVAVTAGRWLGLTLAAIAFFGGCAFPLYSLSVAHLNDSLEAEEMVAASSSLLLVYGVGAILGPYLGSVFMSLVVPEGLFLFVAGAGALVALFALYRMSQRAPVPVEERAGFVALPRTSPVVLELDPRAEAPETQEPEEETTAGTGPEESRPGE